MPIDLQATDIDVVDPAATRAFKCFSAAPRVRK
jgi:hypothetical protein